MESLINSLKEQWNIPKKGVHREIGTLHELVCQFNPGYDYTDEATSYPPDMLDFWKTSDGAELFRDSTYGQWGLAICSYQTITRINQIEKKERQSDFASSDLIIGQFIGDSDLLLRFGNGKIAVATPLEKRSEWEVVANNFQEFLEIYTRLDGDKFWE